MQVIAADLEQRSQFTSGCDALECMPQRLLGASGRPIMSEFRSLHGPEEGTRLWKEAVCIRVVDSQSKASRTGPHNGHCREFGGAAHI